MTKRKREVENNITPELISECEKKFNSDKLNIVARNAINLIGSTFSTVNSARLNEINHFFLHSVKKRNVCATNQGASGRCWMFAALNIFRHLVINSLDLEQFEFSEVYLFFWDKLERSNTYIKWFIDNDEKPGQRTYDYMLEHYMSDGGWWTTFANLVSKYGLIPKTAMKETFQSEDSEEMNKVIKEHLDSCVNWIRLNRKKESVESLNKYRIEMLKTIYNILVKFLGEPPKKFNSYFNSEENSYIIEKISPKEFLDIVAPDINMVNDYITLTHIPTKGVKYYSLYSILNTNNVYEGENCSFFNVPLDELVKYAIKSISNGFAVWFAGDVNKSFNWAYSCLDDKLDDSKSVFPEIETKFDKGDRMLLGNVQSNHAMALTGFNTDKNEKPTEWQVENSWGFFDNEIPGLDGFLCMSHSWFEKYVTQIVINKKFLSRTLKKQLAEKEPIQLQPWESFAPALNIKGLRQPTNYLSTLSKRKL